MTRNAPRAYPDWHDPHDEAWWATWNAWTRRPAPKARRSRPAADLSPVPGEVTQQRTRVVDAPKSRPEAAPPLTALDIPVSGPRVETPRHQRGTPKRGTR